MSKFGNNISNHNFNPKGPVIHFLTGRVGWWDLSRGMPKNMTLEGGPDKKILGVKGGVNQEILSSFAVMASVITD